MISKMDYLVILLFTFYLLLLIFVICLTLDCLFEKPVNIKGAHVLVTGGSSGIGKEVAREALRLGANVTILARNTEKLNEIQKNTGNYQYIQRGTTH